MKEINTMAPGLLRASWSTNSWRRGMVFPLFIGCLVEVVFIVGATTGAGVLAIIVGCGILGLYCAMAPVEKAFLVYLLAVPNQRMAVLGDVSITLLNVAVVILLFRVISGIANRSFLFWISTALMGALACLNFYQNGAWVGPVLFVKVWGELLLFIVVFKNKNFDSNWFLKCSLFYIVGCLLMGVGEVLKPGDGIALRLGMGDDSFNDPNIMGNCFSFGIAMILLVVTLYRIRTSMKIVLGVFALGLLVLGLMTSSRAFLLGFVAICTGYLVCGGSSFNRWKILFPMISGFGMILCVAICFPESPLGEIWNNLIMRIENPRGEDISGGRFDIWAGYWEVYTSSIENIVWGASGDPRLYGMMATHNAFLTTLVHWGVFGSLFFLMALFSLFRELYVGYRALYGAPTLLGAMCVCLLLLNWMTLSNMTDMNAIACMFLSCCALFTDGMGKNVLVIDVANQAVNFQKKR